MDFNFWLFVILGILWLFIAGFLLNVAFSILLPTVIAAVSWKYIFAFMILYFFVNVKILK